MTNSKRFGSSPERWEAYQRASGVPVKAASPLPKGAYVMKPDYLKGGDSSQAG